MLEEFTTPEFIKITECHAWQGQGNCSNLTPGSVHEVIHIKGLENTSDGIYVDGVSQPVKVMSDEYSALWPIGTNGKAKKGEKFSEEEIEKFRKIFEKSRSESKKKAIFAKNNSINNKTKKKKMSSKTKGQMTKTEIAVMEGIASATGKKTSHKALVGKEANLSEVDAELSGIDTAKVARKMKRAGLLTYEWQNDKEGNRTGERLIAITQEGFDVLQLGAKEPKKPAPKKKAEKAPAKKKAEKAPAKKKAEKAPAKNKPAVSGVAGSTKEDLEFLIGDEDADFSVTLEGKTFTVSSQYGEHQLKVKTLKALKAAKAYTEDDWLTNIEDGKLTELD